MTIVIIASIFVIPSQTTTVQWVAAVVLGIFGGFAAIAEIVGLFERIISVPLKRKKTTGITFPEGHQSSDLQVVKEVSRTGRSSVFLTQQSDKSFFFLKKIPKNLSCTLDYSEVILDPEKFAIPISIWEDEKFVYEKIPAPASEKSRS